MSDLLELRDNREEHASWQALFAEPLRADLNESEEVKLLLSAGLLVLIEGEERTALQIGRRAVYPEGYEFIGDTVLRLLARLRRSARRCRVHSRRQDETVSETSTLAPLAPGSSGPEAPTADRLV